MHEGNLCLHHSLEIIDLPFYGGQSKSGPTIGGTTKPRMCTETEPSSGGGYGLSCVPPHQVHRMKLSSQCDGIWRQLGLNEATGWGPMMGLVLL